MGILCTSILSTFTNMTMAIEIYIYAFNIFRHILISLRVNCNDVENHTLPEFLLDKTEMFLKLALKNLPKNTETINSCFEF